MSVCVSCEHPLLIGTDQDELEPVPDDLQLPCNCHYHWECFLELAAEVALCLNCPFCGKHLPTNQPGPSTTSTVIPTPHENVAVLTRYHNEGGIQENYDILPDIREEAYLIANPEARPARAFHTMCAAGDVDGMLAVLSAADEEDEDEDEDGEGEEGGSRLGVDQVLRYQDPLNQMKSTLHVAIEEDQVEPALLLLFLASGIPSEYLPAQTLQVAEARRLQRPSLAGAEHDIRGLKDAQGRTAEEYAYQVGGRWLSFIEAGMFA